ncbi:MAG: 3-dehydroquinate synthase, partial [Desulfocapsaceae bacterium]
MNELQVGLGERSYPISIEADCLKRVAGELARNYPASRYCIIADDTVAGLYGGELLASLEKEGLKADLLSFAHGEEHKNLATVSQLLSEAARRRVDRKSMFIALGGGVSGDVAGFVAATYMRGVPFIQIPTSLLAQVDSSVGGKTGVDLPEGKNLVGAFCQPLAVFIDPEVLRTLPQKQYINGMAEVIKHGIIRDGGYFQLLADKRRQVMELDPRTLQEMIFISCRIKAKVVGEDEKETDIRRILNFGHTIGHAVEAASEFGIAHGFAVAIGMVAAARLSQMKGVLAADKVETIAALLKQYGLPTEIPGDLDRRRIKSYLLTDKKRVGTRTSYV